MWSTPCFYCTEWATYIHNFLFLGNPVFVHGFSAHFELWSYCNDMWKSFSSLLFKGWQPASLIWLLWCDLYSSLQKMYLITDYIENTDGRGGSLKSREHGYHGKMKTQLMCQSGCRFTLVLSSKSYLPAAALHAMCSVLSPVKGIWSRNLYSSS